MSAVTLSGLSVTIDGHEILRPTDLTVESGEWVTVIGPNGAGKSTLLRAVGGLVRYAGAMTLFDRPAAGLKRRDRARQHQYHPDDAHHPLIEEAHLGQPHLAARRQLLDRRRSCGEVGRVRV